ncbi:MAG: tetratricopeptide repeat protein [Betaproteobacteria bacterium]|nr:tetratricopeptide repeat protein [Betaproteobacteria bacterium]
MEHWQSYLRGRLFELFGLNAQAIAAYSAATRLRADFLRPANRIAYLLASQERFAEAEPYFQAVLRVAPDNAVAHFNLAYTYDKRGQYDQAVHEFRAATRLNPKIDRAWYGLGLAHAQLGQHREAAEALEQAATLQPMNHHAWYQLGMALHVTGNSERFLQVVMHLLRFDPKATRRLIVDTGRSDLTHLVQHLVV